jgi:homoserine kinase
MTTSLLRRCRVAVPATCANLGPGFDVLALALELQNEVTVEQRLDTEGIELDCGDDAPEELRDPQRNLVALAWARACGAMEVPATGVAITCVNRIPLRRGLGSSAAAALGGIIAAVAIHRPPWDDTRILAECAALEGHPDNAAAALHGGLTIVAPGLPPATMTVGDELRCVVLVPDVELSTAAARAVVPQSFSRDDAIYNAGRIALLVRAVADRDWDALGAAMDDRWHQPQRTALMPWLPDLIGAARAAGAVGACLSGAGPSVLALCWRGADRIEEALLGAARTHGIGGRCIHSRVRDFGSRVDTSLVI